MIRQGLLAAATGLGGADEQSPYLQADASAAHSAAAHVMPLLADGRLTQRIDEVRLSEAAEAHRRLEAREVPGRIVLTV